MANPKACTLLLLLFYVSFLNNPVASNSPAASSGGNDDQLETWIIQVKNPENITLVRLPEFMQKWYLELLSADHIQAHTNGTLNDDRIIHSYSHAMTGFAARLTQKELEVIKQQPWFLYAYPDVKYELHTVHSPQFLGLTDNYWKHKNSGEGIIIASVDSGVTPFHPSFQDPTMPPPPAKWNGLCAILPFCNNKLIGLKSVVANSSPLDEVGHGSHTASTAAGSLVQNVSVADGPSGCASGMAPKAHVAVYKVCAKDGCASYDILAGIGAAIRDGADIINLSIGTSSWSPFSSDSVTVGSFSAVRQGVFVSVSAGNSGPAPSTLRAEAPWIMTVGASSTDRTTSAVVKLGNGVEIEGQSINQPKDFSNKMYPLLYAGNIPGIEKAYCRSDSFDGVDVKGKIVICEYGGLVERPQKALNVKNAGGAGMILINDPTTSATVQADLLELPSSYITYEDGAKVKSYIDAAGSSAIATIQYKGWVDGHRAPMVGSFSSRGPNLNSKGILKPDIIAPGVNVLAGVPLRGFNVQSGTSMAAPHIAGLAALLKHEHPDWSPAALKSAMMTTAYQTDNTGGPILDEKRQPANYFAIGAGHVNITAASDPGLVYETRQEEYISYLCGLDLTNQQVTAILNRSEVLDCSKECKIAEKDLNYPSITVNLVAGAPNVTVQRRVMNVGEPCETYKAQIEVPFGLCATVEPPVLTFSKLKEEKSFTVIFASPPTAGFGYAQGQLKWVSDKHVVRSPISIGFSVATS